MSVTGKEPPPRSTDLEGWRRAVKDGQYHHFRLEEIVAAIQDLGPHADKTVLNPLIRHFSDTVLGILRGLVGFHHRNGGQDIIEQAHSRIIEALLTPTSSDGKGLRVAFAARVKFRVKDVLVTEARGAWKSKEITPETPEPTHNPSNNMDEHIDVEKVLEQITDDRKRLAFRLHMDGIPCKSDRTSSIATALNISEKTARVWIEEIQKKLSSTSEVQELLLSDTRGIS